MKRLDHPHIIKLYQVCLIFILFVDKINRTGTNYDKTLICNVQYISITPHTNFYCLFPFPIRAILVIRNVGQTIMGLYDPLKSTLKLIIALILQVMETKNMIYLVSEYASQGEIFGEFILHIYLFNIIFSPKNFIMLLHFIFS